MAGRADFAGAADPPPRPEYQMFEDEEEEEDTGANHGQRFTDDANATAIDDSEALLQSDA